MTREETAHVRKCLKDLICPNCDHANDISGQVTDAEIEGGGEIRYDCWNCGWNDVVSSDIFLDGWDGDMPPDANG